MKIDVDPARLGLPADSTKEQVEAAFEARLGKPTLIEGERDVWKKRAQDNQAELVKLQAIVNDASAKKRDIMIQAAIDSGKIAAAQKGVAEKIYDKGEDLFNEWVKSQEETAYLMTRASLQMPMTGPSKDPEIELAQRVLEIQANNEKVTRPEAVRLAFKDRDLFRRVSEARQAKSVGGKEGGE